MFDIFGMTNCRVRCYFAFLPWCLSFWSILTMKFKELPSWCRIKQFLNKYPSCLFEFFIDTKTGLSTFNIHFNVYIDRSIVYIRSIGSIILTVCGERWLNMSVDYVFVTSQLTIKVYISQVIITIRRRKIDRKVHSLHMWNNNNNIIQRVPAQKYNFEAR